MGATLAGIMPRTTVVGVEGMRISGFAVGCCAWQFDTAIMHAATQAIAGDCVLMAAFILAENSQTVADLRTARSGVWTTMTEVSTHPDGTPMVRPTGRW